MTLVSARRALPMLRACRRRAARQLATALVALMGVLAVPAFAQVTNVRSAQPIIAVPSLSELRVAQESFESFRRTHLPIWAAPRPANSSCEAQVGRFCYWYDEAEPDPPRESLAIRAARERLLARLDSAGRADPNDHWISAQRVRYLAEAERYDDAIAVSRDCTVRDWWCSALQGFAFHVAGNAAAADSSFAGALALMDPRNRCAWRDVKFLLDDALLKRYRQLNCEQRETFEERLWWLARPMLSSPGNDARAEFYSRRMMSIFMEDASSTYQMGFDEDERELLLRYGWPRAWSRDGSFMARSSFDLPVVGHEPSPAPPLLPAPIVIDEPATSDSTYWRGKRRPVHARYAPAYAKRLLALEHQAALFRRGDSSLVVAAWSIGGDSALNAAAAEPNELRAALVLTRGAEGDAVIARDERAGRRGTLQLSGPWGGTLMSLEVSAPRHKTLARARYGIGGGKPSPARIQLSDLVLFDPSSALPDRVEDVVPLMRTSERVTVGSRVGIYWEAYNTDPAGEEIGVSITVAPDGGGAWLRRRLVALHLAREAKPVTVGIRDQSARGTPVSPRSVIVDLATLTPGRYVLQLELDAGTGNVVRTERRISVIPAPR